MYLIFIYMKKTYRQLMKDCFYPDNLSDYDLPKNSKLNELIDKSYIINLNKHKFKLKRFMKNKNHKNFKNNFNVINAIDGKKLKKENISLDKVKLTYEWNDYLKVSAIPQIKNLLLNNQVTMSDTEIGICLSHLKCWKDFHKNSKQGNYALIVEDDVVFCDNFENKLKLILDSIENIKHHMLYLGYLPDRWSFDVDDLNDFCYKIKNGVWFLSYIISWEAINELINRLPIFGPVDMWIQLQFDFLNPIGTKKFLCIQEDYYKSSNTYSFFSGKHNQF